MIPLLSFLLLLVPTEEQAGDLFEAGVRLLLNNLIDDIFIPNRKIRESYDFIIVGSGAAGSVTANRLSTKYKNLTVLLIEAGSTESKYELMPYIAPIFQWSKHNWDYRMEPQPNVCLAMNDLKCMYPRGKALGGSTVINYMVHAVGNKFDYDDIAAAGNPGWSYTDVLARFKRLERQVLSQNVDAAYHGTSGEQTVSNVFYAETAEAFLRAGVQVGSRVTDYNGRYATGYSLAQAHVQRGRRQSAARAFIVPVKDRTNLDILINTRVTKIEIDPVSKTAIGVRFGASNRLVRANREVIVSAGTFHSPQLLMLSGVGPRDNLDAIGIPVIKELPVGKRMYDHVTYSAQIYIINKTVENFYTAINPISLLEWELFGTGMLTQLGGIEALAMVKLNDSQTDDRPDVEIIFAGLGGHQSDSGFINRRLLGISDRYYDIMFKPFEGQPAFTVLPVLQRPKSKGYLELVSRDINVPPKFYGGYLQHADDRTLMVEALKYCNRLAATPAFQAYDATLIDTVIPECAHLGFGTDGYLNCSLNYFTSPAHSQVGTCKMGPDGDRERVVDSQLRVIGIANLRVADLSVMAFPISGKMSMPAMMIGEYLADIL